MLVVCWLRMVRWLVRVGMFVLVSCMLRFMFCVRLVRMYVVLLFM